MCANFFNSPSYLFGMNSLFNTVKDLGSKLDSKMCSSQYKGEQYSHCPSRGSTSTDIASNSIHFFSSHITLLTHLVLIRN